MATSINCIHNHSPPLPRLRAYSAPNIPVFSNPSAYLTSTTSSILTIAHPLVTPPYQTIVFRRGPNHKPYRQLPAIISRLATLDAGSRDASAFTNNNWARLVDENWDAVQQELWDTFKANTTCSRCGIREYRTGRTRTKRLAIQVATKIRVDLRNLRAYHLSRALVEAYCKLFDHLENDVVVGVGDSYAVARGRMGWVRGARIRSITMNE